MYMHSNERCVHTSKYANETLIKYIKNYLGPLEMFFGASLNEHICELSNYNNAFL